jgi:ATP-dependent Lhr-like helicase
MEVLGPVTAGQLAASLHGVKPMLIDQALLALETEGRVLRGHFSPRPPREGTGERLLEWCDRRLLARIHRYTLNRLRAEIEPVTAAEYMRFLLHWQHIVGDDQMTGMEGLAAVIEQLDGYEVPAVAWEHDVLPARVRDYDSSYLDMLCLSGRVAWGRLTPMDGPMKSPLRTSPMALMVRERAALWRIAEEAHPDLLTSDARAVYDALGSRGASFFHELVAITGRLRTQIERALGELAGAGLVTADSYSGLRALLVPEDKKKDYAGRRRGSPYGVDTAGRWSLLQSVDCGNERTEAVARTLLKRYGVVFRALLARETRMPTWRELAMVYRRLEARGEIRGGRFVAGFGGEQFALPEAVGRLRAVRKQEKAGDMIVLSAADPLNLVGLVTPDARVTAISRNRVLFRDGVAIAALESSTVRRLAESDVDDATLRSLLVRRGNARALKPYFRVPSKREMEMMHRRRIAANDEADRDGRISKP